ncbi:hypothetical protein B0T13DRAFT_493356 [Neurospora crassa]|nr:hypothetical protein B0T13DRAFT_493356 [Neurospora crassa]
MSIAKKQSSKTKCPEVTSSLRLSTTFNHSTQPVYLPTLTSFKRQRRPSPSPSSSFNLSTKPELNSETDGPLTVTPPQAEGLFSTRQIKPLHRSRPRFQKFTTSSTSPKEYQRKSSDLARTAAHDVRTGAHTIPRSETRTKTTSLSANTPMTSAEWCQAKQDDPAAVSLALATRDLIGMSMSVDMQEEGFGQNTREEKEEKKEKKKEEERPKKKKNKPTKKGWDEEKHSRRVFEWIPSPGPGGLEPVPEEFVKGTVS